jgi:hypothetical protein
VSDTALSRADAAPAGPVFRSGWHWRPLVPPVARLALVPAALALVAALALILALVQVVRGAVQQGDLRRQASAEHADATWRCKALQGLLQRKTCLKELETPAHDDDRGPGTRSR